MLEKVTGGIKGIVMRREIDLDEKCWGILHGGNLERAVIGESRIEQR